MNRFGLVFVSLALLSGCSSARQSMGATYTAGGTYTLVEPDITLSDAKQTVQLGQYSIRLLSIADDGTTQIRVAQTRRVLSARPGECFVSYEFGREGLQLLSASKTTGTATMKSIGCMRH
jgi:predicted ATPase